MHASVYASVYAATFYRELMGRLHSVSSICREIFSREAKLCLLVCRHYMLHAELAIYNHLMVSSPMTSVGLPSMNLVDPPTCTCMISIHFKFHPFHYKFPFCMLASLQSLLKANTAQTLSDNAAYLASWRRTGLLTVGSAKAAKAITCAWDPRDLIQWQSPFGCGGNMLHAHVSDSGLLSPVLMKVLVEDLGIDINSRDLLGRTALHLLMKKLTGHRQPWAEWTAALLDLGADTLLTDAAGYTPAEYLLRYATGSEVAPEALDLKMRLASMLNQQRRVEIQAATTPSLAGDAVGGAGAASAVSADGQAIFAAPVMEHLIDDAAGPANATVGDGSAAPATPPRPAARGATASFTSPPPATAAAEATSIATFPSFASPAGRAYLGGPDPMVPLRAVSELGQSAAAAYLTSAGQEVSGGYADADRVSAGGLGFGSPIPRPGPSSSVSSRAFDEAAARTPSSMPSPSRHSVALSSSPSLTMTPRRQQQAQQLQHHYAVLLVDRRPFHMTSFQVDAPPGRPLLHCYGSPSCNKSSSLVSGERTLHRESKVIEGLPGRLPPMIDHRRIRPIEGSSKMDDAHLTALRNSEEPESGYAVAMAIGPFVGPGADKACQRVVKQWRAGASVCLKQRVCLAACDGAGFTVEAAVIADSLAENTQKIAAPQPPPPGRTLNTDSNAGFRAADSSELDGDPRDDDIAPASSIRAQLQAAPAAPAANGAAAAAPVATVLSPAITLPTTRRRAMLGDADQKSEQDRLESGACPQKHGGAAICEFSLCAWARLAVSTASGGAIRDATLAAHWVEVVRHVDAHQDAMSAMLSPLRVLPPSTSADLAASPFASASTSAPAPAATPQLRPGMVHVVAKQPYGEEAQPRIKAIKTMTEPISLAGKGDTGDGEGAVGASADAGGRLLPRAIAAGRGSPSKPSRPEAQTGQLRANGPFPRFLPATANGTAMMRSPPPFFASPSTLRRLAASNIQSIYASQQAQQHLLSPPSGATPSVAAAATRARYPIGATGAGNGAPSSLATPARALFGPEAHGRAETAADAAASVGAPGARVAHGPADASGAHGGGNGTVRTSETAGDGVAQSLMQAMQQMSLQ